MLHKWFDSRQAAEVGAALADNVALLSSSGAGRRQEGKGDTEKLNKFLEKFLQRVDNEVHALPLNVFKRAKLANSFKWRLLEKGVDKDLVDELTQVLVQRLTRSRANPPVAERLQRPTSVRRDTGTIQMLMLRGSELAAHHEHAEAVGYYEQLLDIDARNAPVHNNLGVSLCAVGRYSEAWQHYRQAIAINENLPDAQLNLGTLMRYLGRFVESEQPLRRALKLRPGSTDARASLGATLFMLGRLKEAKDLLDSALRAAPRNLQAMQTMGQLLARQGDFAGAETWFRRVLEVDPKAPAWVGLAGLRRMTSEDSAWLKGAQRCADSGLEPLVEANVRFAIGKYFDETGDFERAFRSVQRANELVKTGSQPYDRDARSGYVDDLIRTYPIPPSPRPQQGGSDSQVPVFVVGMPRSGTTLVAQVIGSHAKAKSAGELEFWSFTMQKHMTRLRTEPPDHATCKKLAEKYLRVLTAPFPHAQRVVDKSPFNSDILGIIHSVLPQARFIYVQRDPIDTCLSCYFQDFPPALNFTQDLADLEHYYRQHRRLIEHWRQYLPPQTLLDVPYEALTGDQETWSRRIMEFLGLEWDANCLVFQRTEQPVLTASYWQVRQKIYKGSVGRWRNYQKFIGPLLSLKGME